jgi:hypothetical protein
VEGLLPARAFRRWILATAAGVRISLERRRVPAVHFASSIESSLALQRASAMASSVPLDLRPGLPGAPLGLRPGGHGGDSLIPRIPVTHVNEARIQ